MNDEILDKIIEEALEGIISKATDGLIDPFSFMYKLIKFITNEPNPPNSEDIRRHYEIICNRHDIPIIENSIFNGVIDETIDETF